MVWDNDAVKSATESAKVEIDDSTKRDDETAETEDSGASEDETDDTPKEEKIADKKLSDLEYMEALKKKREAAKIKKAADKTGHGPVKFFTVQVRGLGLKHKKKHVKQFFKPLQVKSIRLPRMIRGMAYVGFKTERLMKQALNKDKSFLGW